MKRVQKTKGKITQERRVEGSEDSEVINRLLKKRR